MPTAPVIVAHRGCGPWNLPENSIEAMEASSAAGVSWVECDVWPARDLTPMVIHDSTLDRTTERSGIVAHCTRDELRGVRLRDAHGAITSATLPALETMLARLNGRVGVIIEIKPENDRAFVREVVALARKYPGPWSIQSFDMDNIRHAREMGLESELALLTDGAFPIGATTPVVRCNYHDVKNSRLVELLHSAGRRVGVWTVNAPDEIAAMVTLGVDEITTDQPILALQIAGDMQSPRDPRGAS